MSDYQLRDNDGQSEEIVVRVDCRMESLRTYIKGRLKGSRKGNDRKPYRTLKSNLRRMFVNKPASRQSGCFRLMDFGK